MKFQEFAPKWHHAIQLFKEGKLEEYGEYLYHNNMSISAISRCVVGEAYDWQAIYNYPKRATDKVGELVNNDKFCYECYKAGYDFHGCFDIGGYIERPDEFEQRIAEFEKHFCEAHSK